MPLCFLFFRSPRNQNQAPVKAKQKALRKQHGNKKESSTVCSDNESVDQTLGDEEKKYEDTKTETCEEANKMATDESDGEEKIGVRTSGRMTRNREKQIKEEEDGKAKTKERKVKTEGKKAEETKVKGKVESEISKKELSEKDDSKIDSKSDASEGKVEKGGPPGKQNKGSESERKTPGRSKVETKTETFEGDGIVKTRRVSEKEGGRDVEENEAGKTIEIDKKSVALLKEDGSERKDKSDKAVVKKQDSDSLKDDVKSIDDDESVKKEVKAESATSTVIDEKTAKECDKTKEEQSSKDVEESQEEGESEADSSEEHEEFNEDSDYDPEYDPDRLWCVCRKPHGNR